MLNIENLKITRHAVKAIADRGVDVDVLADTLRHPAVIEPHEGKRRFVGRSGLVCVIAGDDEEPVLITILLRSSEQWNNDDARRRFEN